MKSVERFLKDGCKHFSGYANGENIYDSGYDEMMNEDRIDQVNEGA